MEQWIETASGNRISKQAHISGSDHILIAGNTTVSAGVELHGDVRMVEPGKTAIQIGKFCYLGDNVNVCPPLVTKKTNSKGVEVSIHKTCKLGSYTVIGANSTIRSSNVGNRVIIGPGCTLQDSSMVHDCVIIKEHTYIPANYNIPPFSLVYSQKEPYTKNQTITIEPLPESYKKIIETASKYSYINNQFTPSEMP